MWMYNHAGAVVLASRNPEVGNMVAGALATIGASAPRLSSVSNLSDCVNAVRLLHPSVVLVDDDVTEAPGASLLHQLQAAQAGVRIIYIASHHSLDLEREVRREGVLFYIASPVEMDMLEAKLVGILKGLLRSNPN
jgi:response regulator of citrate/malate metabolism